MLNFRLVITISTALLYTFVCFAASQTCWVCQDCDPYMQPNYQKIQKAIDVANPGDTIIIVAEEYPFGSAHIIEYSENLIIDKSLTITCKRIHPVLGLPIITVSDYMETGSIIHVKKSAKDTVISNLHIRGPVVDNTSCDGDPRAHFRENTGIYIESPRCTIDNCTITHTMTGILIDTGTGIDPSGINISNCKIGEPFIGVVNGFWVKETDWTDNHQGKPIVHPGNGFGIVILNCDSTNSSSMKTNLMKQNKVLSNRYQDVLRVHR